MLMDEDFGLGSVMDRMVVKNEYIFARGRDNIRSDEITFEGRHFSKPSMGIWKVNPKHPMTISSHSKHPFGVDSYVTIQHDEKAKVTPGKAYERKDLWDVSAYFLFPGTLSEQENVLATIDDAFITKRGKGPVTLFYIPEGINIESGVQFAVQTMQTQLSNLAYRTFFYQQHQIYSFDRAKNKHINEGVISIPLEKAQAVLYDVFVPELEKRYGSVAKR